MSGHPHFLSRFIDVLGHRHSGQNGRSAEASHFEDSEDTRTESAMLDAFAAAFGGQVAELESSFLPLGKDLCNVVDHLQRLVRVAEEGFFSLRSTLAGGTLGELDGLGLRSIELIQTRLGDVSRHLEPLQEVSTDLSRLCALGHELKRVGAFLRACGSNFAVESARREESREAFSSFVGELRDIAAQIGTLADHMIEASRSTIGQLGNARSRIHGNLEKVRGLASLVHGAFTNASGEIGELLTQTRQAVDRIEAHRQAIVQRTGGIIFYLQFGDLVRQQCEHVVSAVRDAVEAASSDDEEERASLPLIVRTAVAQMELIQGEVNEARQHLADGYSALNRELEQLAECGRDLGRGATSTGSSSVVSPWTRLRAQLLELDSIRQQEQRLSGDARNIAVEAGTAVTTLHARLAGVQEVSGNLHFLALNAIVQTARLGEKGRTLEELAKHVNGLHRDCEVIVPKVLQLLDGIGKRVARLTTERQDLEQLDLSGLQQIEQAQNSSNAAMRDVISLGRTGAEKLDHALSGLEVLVTLAAQIADHRADLEAIRDRLPEPAMNAATAQLEARIMERYTMQSERDAHLRARQQGTTAASFEPGAFALSNEARKGDPALTAASESDLGDNIELF